MTRQFLLICLFFLNLVASTYSFGQVDPEYSDEIENLVSQRKFEDAMLLLDSLLENNPHANLIRAEAYLLKALVLQSQKKLWPAFHLADSLYRSGVFENSPELQMKTLLVLGNVNYSRFRENKAAAVYLKIDSLGDLYPQGVKTQIKALTNLGMLMMTVEEGRKGNQLLSTDYYYSKGLRLAQEAKDSTASFDLLTFLTNQDLGKGKIDSIEQVYFQAIQYFEKKNNLKMLSSALWGLGSAYETEGLPEKAEKVFLKNIQLNSQNINGLARAHWIYANFLNRKNDLDGAILEFETAQKLFLSEQEPDIGPLNGTIYNLATLYNKVGRDREAYEYLNKAWVMQDSIDKAMEYDLLKELEFKYQAAQKDKAIAELETETQRRNFQLLLGLAALVFIAGGFLFFFFYQRKKLALANKITELDQVKSQFFENITHEFRTPLTLIDSPLQFLEKDHQLSPAAESKIALIRNQSDRMLQLVDQILSLNQLQNGEINVLLKKSTLRQVIQAFAEPFEFGAKERKIDWEGQLNFSNQPVWLDQDLIQKVVNNLLGNALKYTPEGGKIKINGSDDQKILTLKIENTVSDLESRDLKRIFDRFVQKDSHSSGFGIGLSLVKAIIQRIYGTLEASLQEHNLVIEIKIPVDLKLLPKNAIVLEENPSQEKATTSDPVGIDEKPILLLAEDHPDTREILSELFQKDYQVITSSTGEEAWRICQELVPDLILSDISMPEVSGLELCRRIRTHEFLSHVPILLLTASSSLSFQIAGTEVEADGYITKPFNHQLLTIEVKKLIDQRKKLRDRYSKEVILKPVDLAINSAEELFLEKLQKVVAENMENPDFSAEHFAAAMDMSRMQLHRKLKHLTGLSAMEFLKDQRLKTAATLLKREDLSISDVAYSVGFNDLSHFSKSFKSSHGLSPSEFQQSE